MALARVKTWSSGEILTASDLNAEFNNLLNNARDLVSPLTASLDMNGFELIMDGDADSSLTSDTDDRLDVRLGGVDVFIFDGTTASIVNGITFTGAITGTGPTIAPHGETNVPITLKGKGTGKVVLGQATSTEIQLAADQPLTDSSGNEFLKFVKTSTAVNEVTITNAAAGSGPSISATGGDTDIDLVLSAKGAGFVTASDAGFAVRGSGDATKKARFEVDGITAGNTRVLSVQDEDGTIALTSEFAYANVAGSSGRQTYPAGWIQGLTFSEAADTAHDTTIAAGSCRDATDAHNMILASAITKRIDASWAVGTDQGGLDGSESVAGTPDADTWYFLWLIKRSDTGVVDALYSESASAPTMPTNYDYKRLIGMVRTDGSANIYAYSAVEMAGGGLEFLWDVATQDVAVTNQGSTAALRVMRVPIGLTVWAVMTAFGSDADGNVEFYFSSPDVSDQAATNGGLLQLRPGVDGVAGGQLYIRTDTSGQIRTVSSSGSANSVLRMYTLGFQWSRR